MSVTKKEHKDILIALLAELGAAKRARSEPEYIFTAAAVGTFGALCWGVATLSRSDFLDMFWTHPALIAFGYIIGVSIALTAKIYNDHGKFMATRDDQANVARNLNEIAPDLVPLSLRSPPSKAIGFLYTLGFLWVAAAFSAAFCFRILISN